eukprot:5208551-Amphidinium_carterae.1
MITGGSSSLKGASGSKSTPGKGSGRGVLGAHSLRPPEASQPPQHAPEHLKEKLVRQPWLRTESREVERTP